MSCLTRSADHQMDLSEWKQHPAGHREELRKAGEAEAILHGFRDETRCMRWMTIRMATTPGRQYWNQEDGSFAFTFLKGLPTSNASNQTVSKPKSKTQTFSNTHILKTFTSPASFCSELLENVLLWNESKPRKRRTWDMENRRAHTGGWRRDPSADGSLWCRRSMPSWECSSVTQDPNMWRLSSRASPPSSSYPS